MDRGDSVYDDNIYCNKHQSLRVKQGLHIGLMSQIIRGDKLRPEVVSCLTAHGGVCAMNSPRSFFSFEKESNFLRRDFLRLRISVRGEKKRDKGTVSKSVQECTNLSLIYSEMKALCVCLACQL